MSLSLYDITIVPFIRGLKNMAMFLEQGEAWAKENGKNDETFLTARLNPDMADLIFQVQRASNAAKLAAVKIGGVNDEPFENDESTYAEVQARLSKTIEFLEKVPKENFDDKLDFVITGLPGAPPGVGFSAQDYALKFAIPNFYFHDVAAYAILRMIGVPLGKRDYIGQP